MADALVFPRLIYRGLPDTLGQGTHTNKDGDLVGETAECKSADEFELKKKDGWRLTSDDKAAAKAADKK